MNSAQLVTVFLAIIAACGASVVTGIFMRPKVTAEAKAADAGSEVSISGDARAWAITFAERADRAEQRADEAEAEAALAKTAVQDVTRRCEATERKVDDLIGYVLTCQAAIRTLGGVVPAPPASLRPPL